MNLIRNTQLCDSLNASLREGTLGIQSSCDLLKAIIRERSWEERKIRTGEVIKLRSFRELLTLPPLEGFGEKVEDVERLIGTDAELVTQFREALKEKTGPKTEENCCNNITATQAQKTGTSRSYTLSRLAKESPELFERVKNGELSANAAAIQAGWRKKPSGLDLLRSAWKKASQSERETFLTEVA